MNTTNPEKPGESLLPAPVRKGRLSLEEAIEARRSRRVLGQRPLTPAEVSQLCWAGQGITDADERLRASPSAGAIYPLELYLITAEGVDRYEPETHALRRHLTGDVRRALRRAAMDQEVVSDAPACVAIAGDVGRMARKYGERAERYCFMEAGHAAQNILLEATALRLAGVPVGAFDDDDAAAVLRLPKGQRLLYLVPIGPLPDRPAGH